MLSGWIPNGWLSVFWRDNGAWFGEVGALVYALLIPSKQLYLTVEFL